MNDKTRVQPAPRRDDLDIGAIPIAGKLSSAQPVPAAISTSASASPVPPVGGANRPRSRPPLANRLLPPALVITGLLIAYLTLSQLGAALFLPRLLANHWDQQLGRPVTIARAQWQPLSLTLVLHNGIIGPHRSDPHDHLDPLLSFRTLRVKLNPGALLFIPPRLGKLELEQPFLHLLRDEEGEYNLEWLRRLAMESNWLPRKLLISNGRLLYSDRGYRHPSPSTATSGEFKGELREVNGGWLVSRAGANGPLRPDLAFDALGPQGAMVKLQSQPTPGEIPASVGLGLTIRELPLKALATYLHPLLDQQIDDGRLSLQARFYPLANGGLALEQQLEIRGLKLGRAPDRQGGDPDLQLLLALLSNRDQLIKLKLPMTIPADRRDSPYLRELAAALDQLLEQARFTPLTLLAAGKTGRDIFFDSSLSAIKAATETENRSLSSLSLDFAPGSAALSREAGGRLDRLAALLEDRPLLKLEIGGPLPFLCDRDALQKKREEQLREERREAVVTLARELIDGSEITVSAASMAALRPENAIIGEEQLLALATARRQAVQQRLLMALGQEGQTPESDRIRIVPPSPDPQPPPAGPGCGRIDLNFIP